MPRGKLPLAMGVMIVKCLRLYAGSKAFKIAPASVPGGRIEYRAGKVKGLPIPPASASDKAKLTKLAERAAKAATDGDTAAVERIERDIDEIICRLFDLTAAEINQIETALANTRGQSSDDDDSANE